jgi:hypothetical protein
MQPAHLLQVEPQWRPQSGEKHGAPILATLPMANRDLPALDIQIMHPQSPSLHQA